MTQLGNATRLLGGAGYGLARPGMSSQDCRTRTRHSASPPNLPQLLNHSWGLDQVEFLQPLPVNKRIWGIGIKQRLLLAGQKWSVLVVKKEQVYFHVQRPQLWS